MGIRTSAVKLFAGEKKTRRFGQATIDFTDREELGRHGDTKDEYWSHLTVQSQW